MLVGERRTNLQGLKRNRGSAGENRDQFPRSNSSNATALCCLYQEGRRVIRTYGMAEWIYVRRAGHTCNVPERLRRRLVEIMLFPRASAMRLPGSFLVGDRWEASLQRSR